MGRSLAICFVLCVALAAGASGGPIVNATFALDAGASKVEFQGKSSNFRIYTGPTQFLEVRFGRVQELDAAGKPLAAHSLPALAAVKPEFQTGNETVGGNNATAQFVSIRAPLSAAGESFKPCPGAPSTPSDLASAHITVKAYFGLKENTNFPYGAGNTVTASAGSLKFNIEAAGWPFCSASNSLAVDIDVRSSARGGDEHPVLYDEDGTTFTELVKVADPALPPPETAVRSDDGSVASSSSGTGSASAGTSTSASTSSTNSADAATPPTTRRRLHHLLLRKLLDKPDGVGAGAGDAAHGAAGTGAPGAAPGGGGGSAPGNSAGGAAAHGKSGEPHGSADNSAAAFDKGTAPDAGDVAADDAAAGGRGRGRRPRGHEGGRRGVKLATFLVDAASAAALDLQTYSYDAVDGSARANVSVAMADAGRDGTRVSLVFPSFKTLYYDPSIAITPALDAGYTADEAAGTVTTPVMAVDDTAAATGGAAESKSSAAGAARNGAAAGAAPLQRLAAAAAAAAAVLAALVI